MTGKGHERIGTGEIKNKKLQRTINQFTKIVPSLLGEQAVRERVSPPHFLGRAAFQPPGNQLLPDSQPTQEEQGKACDKEGSSVQACRTGRTGKGPGLFTGLAPTALALALAEGVHGMVVLGSKLLPAGGRTEEREPG